MKQPVSVRSRVRCRKAFPALLDQLTGFGQRESMTIHAISGPGQKSAVSSAQTVEMLQSVAARWRFLKWLGNLKFQGGHPFNYLWSQTLLNFNDYNDRMFILSRIDLGYISKNNLCPSHNCFVALSWDAPESKQKL